MDFKAKIQRLKQLREKQSIINSRINENNTKSNIIYDNKVNNYKKYNTSIQDNDFTSFPNKSLKEQFIKDNKEKYLYLNEEARRQQYIEDLLKNINKNSKHTELLNNIDNLDNLDNLNNNESIIQMIKTMKYNKNSDYSINYTNNDNDTDTDTDTDIDIDTDTDIDTDIDTLSELSDISYITDLSEEDNLYLSDSSVYSSISNNNSNNNSNIKKIVVQNSLINKRKTKEEINNEQLTKQSILEDIEFLKTASPHVKAKCEEYLNNSLNKINKILKIYIVRSRNNFFNISNEIFKSVFHGYKHIPYYKSHLHLNKGDIVKIIFLYDGEVHIKDFIINKWNKKNLQLECNFCNITYTNFEQIIKQSRTKIIIKPNWIIITKITPQELINNCT